MSELILYSAAHWQSRRTAAFGHAFASDQVAELEMGDFLTRHGYANAPVDQALLA